jgi:hypothetical protein
VQLQACKHHLPENKFKECPEGISTYTELFLPNIHYSVPEHNIKECPESIYTCSSSFQTHNCSIQSNNPPSGIKDTGKTDHFEYNPQPKQNKDAFHPPDLNHNKAGNCSLSILRWRQGRATFQR